MIFRRRREYLVKKGTEFTLSSPSFGHGEPIPVKHTCDGDDVSPELRWQGAPSNTKSYALIMYDPDAPIGTFIHWVLYNIPATVNRLVEALPKTRIVEGVGLHGVNDFGFHGYGGPCPPRGHGRHRYFFALHALDVEDTGLPPGATAADLLKRIEGHVVGYAVLMGVYERR